MQNRVTPFGYSSESCGYCKDAANNGCRTASSRASYYFSSKSLTVDVYQILVDRGWRRSGTIFYKPDVLRHCCPHYTIRLPAASFKPSKDQRKAVNRWNDFVLGEEYQKAAARLYPKTKEEKARLKSGFDLVEEVHRSDYESVKKLPEPAHRFEVTLEPAAFSQEKYELFRTYQQHVHKEKPSEISQSGFTRFLCSSPLEKQTLHVNGKQQLLGSYHQCYRLDGRLIAMGVLDLLPHCVSGVYLLYHSDFEKWNFGKLSAMREATLALENGYKNYYMGYYIHSCTKMKYKGDYKMQYVLDPETYDWNPLDEELRGLLDKRAYVSLSRDRKLKEAVIPPKSGNDAATNGSPVYPDAEMKEYILPTAAAAGMAVSSGMSLFELGVPGLMTADEVEEQLDIAITPILVGGRIVEAQDLVQWDSGNVRDPRSIKGIIAELFACLGPEAAWQVIVEFG